MPPVSVAELARRIRGEPEDAAEARWLRESEYARRLREQGHLGPKEGVDPLDLAASGWGVVFARDADPAVREALAPLLEHRRRQACATAERRYRELWGEEGWRPSDDKKSFLARHDAVTGPADPDRLPYYLLMVGSPAEIPWRAQWQLDVKHAVGRLHFDAVEDYAAYAESVVAAETRLPPKDERPSAFFFAPRHAEDNGSRLLSDLLVTPLGESFAAEHGDAWRVDSALAGEATKDRLRSLFEGEAPSLLFAATHGLGLPLGDPRQHRFQGSLVCQDWPEEEPGHLGQAFTADDLPRGADTHGMIACLVACHSGGVPRLDSYLEREGRSRRLTEEPFVSALVQRLLGRRRGALAVLAHVDRAFHWSFLWPTARRSHIEVYASTLRRLASGHPVGSAAELFARHYGECATDLAGLLEDEARGKKVADADLVSAWTAHKDARAFLTFGDPAVRLRRAPTPGD